MSYADAVKQSLECSFDEFPRGADPKTRAEILANLPFDFPPRPIVLGGRVSRAPSEVSQDDLQEGIHFPPLPTTPIPSPTVSPATSPVASPVSSPVSSPLKKKIMKRVKKTGDPKKAKKFNRKKRAQALRRDEEKLERKKAELAEEKKRLADEEERLIQEAIRIEARFKYGATTKRIKKVQRALFTSGEPDGSGPKRVKTVKKVQKKCAEHPTEKVAEPSARQATKKRETQEVDQMAKKSKINYEVFEKKNHFPTPEEMAFFVENVEMSSTPHCKRTNSVYMALERTSILFTGLKKPENIQNSHNHMSKVVDIFIRRMIEMAEGDLETSKYWFKLGYWKYAGDQRFHVMHKTYDEADGQDVINVLTDRMRSDPEIKLDERFHITMCVIKYAEKGYAQNEIMDAFFGIKNNRVVGDSHCLPKAIALGRLKCDQAFAPSVEEKTKLSKKLYKLTGAASVENRERLQLIEAEKLLVAAGMSVDQKEHGWQDLQQLAAHLSDYQIHLWDVNNALPTTKIYEHKPYIRGYEILNPGAKKYIALIYHGSHYEFVTHVKLPSEARFCTVCFKFGGSNHWRKCSAKCKLCGRLDCEPGTDEIPCTECNYTFTSQKCFDAHKKKNAYPLSFSHCEKYFYCQKCGLADRTDNYSGRRHVCDAETFCYVCCLKAEPGHVCSPYVPKNERKSVGETFPSLNVKPCLLKW